MGQELKKIGAGGLLTVFGEPDISLERTGDGQAVVTLHAVDVHDPTTGAVLSNDTSHAVDTLSDTETLNSSLEEIRVILFTCGYRSRVRSWTLGPLEGPRRRLE